MAKKKIEFKKAFTMIELVMTIVSTGFISFLLFKHFMTSQFYSSVNKADTQIVSILENVVMNPVKGYVNGAGGDCSSNNTYKDLSAARAIQCIGWKNVYPWEGTKSNDGTKSYIYEILKDYVGGGQGCKMYLGSNSSDSDSYNVFVDCSNLDSAYSSYKPFIEQKLNSDLRNSLGPIVQKTYFNADSLYSTTGGNNKDGKIGFLLKK